MTLQNAPPGLDYERDKRFSKVRVTLSVIEGVIFIIFMFDLWTCTLHLVSYGIYLLEYGFS